MAASLCTRPSPSTSPPAFASSSTNAATYLPASASSKSVVAGAGDVVCIEHQLYSVNGRLISVVATTDQAGRPLPGPYHFCGVVPGGFAFLAAAGTSSLDSRFFGPVPISDLTPAVPLWTY